MNKGTILVVEDERGYAKMAQLILEEKGYRVIGADNGMEGVEKARKMMPDLILMDIVMPIMNGMEACKLIRDGEKTSKIPIIMCTVRDKVGDIIDSFDKGAIDYVIKPYEPERLIEKIEKTLEKEKK